MNEELRTLLCKLAVDAVSYEYGSEKQVNAENKFFLLSGDKYGIDWDDYYYLMKATTEEMIEYAFKIIELRESLIHDITEKLYDVYHDEAGNEYKGQSISFVHKDLRNKRSNSYWNGLGNLSEFENLVESIGFTVKPLRNRRNQKARVITL